MDSFETAQHFASPVLLLAGIAGMIFDARRRRRPTTQGVISEARYAAASAGLMKYYDGRCIYRFSVSYGYTVGDQTFQGHDALSKSIVALTEDDAKRKLSTTYAQGQFINVTFNPARPSESVLNCDGRGLWHAFVSAGLYCGWPLWQRVFAQVGSALAGIGL